MTPNQQAHGWLFRAQQPCRITRRNYYKPESEYVFDNKSEFAATLSDQFRTSSNWRKAQAKRYTHDTRNGEAAQRLLELESQIVIPDNVWEKARTARFRFRLPRCNLGDESGCRISQASGQFFGVAGKLARQSGHVFGGRVNEAITSRRLDGYRSRFSAESIQVAMRCH